MSNITEERNEKILRKIKGLLSLANNNTNDEEAQSAFMMAQKLMLKHDISMVDVGDEKEKAIEDSQATVYKKLYWWERKLAAIVAENFRTKFYYSNKYINGSKKIKRAVMFMGYEKDVTLAKEIYLLAYEVIDLYSKRFIEAYYAVYEEQRTRDRTMRIKNSYMSGFLDGLNARFAEQVNELKQENALMVLIPRTVEEKYNEKFGDKKGLSMNIPSVDDLVAYQQGANDGKKVDYTKSTIDSHIEF